MGIFEFVVRDERGNGNLQSRWLLEKMVPLKQFGCHSAPWCPVAAWSGKEKAVVPLAGASLGICGGVHDVRARIALPHSD